MSEAPNFIFDQGHMPPPGCIVDMTAAEIDAAERFETGGDPYYQAQAIRGLTLKQAMKLYWLVEKLEFTITYSGIGLSIDPLVVEFTAEFGRQAKSDDDGMAMMKKLRPHQRGCAPEIFALRGKLSPGYDISDGEGGWLPGPFYHYYNFYFAPIRVFMDYNLDPSEMGPLVGPIVRNTDDDTYAVFFSGEIEVVSSVFSGGFYARTGDSLATGWPPLTLNIFGHDFTFFVVTGSGPGYPTFSTITPTYYTIT